MSHPQSTGRRALLTAILGGGLANIMGRPQLGRAESVEPSPRDIQRTTTSFAGGSHASAWMRFEMPDFRRIIISGRINDVPAKILLDSGLGRFVIGKDLAATLGLREVGNVAALGVTGTVQGKAFEGVRITFDNLTIHTATSELYDFSPFAGAVNEPVSAILGRDLFDSLAVDIDFANFRIAFRDAHAKASLPDGFELPLRRDQFGLRSLSVSVENRPPIQATLDLGSDIALAISPEYAAEQMLFADRKSSTSLSAGVAGREEGRVAVLTGLAIGNTLFQQVPFEVPDHWTFVNQAIVGMPVLRRMRVIIDFPHDRISVLPDQKLLRQPFRKDRSGLGAMRLPDRLRIVLVAAGSPAAAAGLNVGDEIVAINDQPLNAEYFRDRPRMGSQPAGTVYYLTLSNREKVKLVLADYF
jgi:hypothetical protein